MKKTKRWTAILLIIVMISSLLPMGVFAEEKKDNTAAYGSVIEKYIEAIKGGWTAAQFEAADLNVELAGTSNTTGNTGYAYKDVDGDGIPELFIVSGESYGAPTGMFWDMYRLENGKPQRVVSSKYRGGYYLCTNGKIKKLASSAYDYNYELYFSYGKASYENNELYFIEKVLYNGIDYPNNPWMYSDNPESWMDSGSMSLYTQITEAKYKEIRNKYQGQAISFTTFDKYVKEPEDPKPDNEGFSIQKNGWIFSNSYEGFGYLTEDGKDDKKFSLSKQRYEEVYGTAYANTTWKEKTWGGNCAGMGLTSTLFYANKLDWSHYKDQYKENFENVNDFYSAIRYDQASLFDPTVIWPSCEDSSIRTLIEQYQCFVGSKNWEKMEMESINALYDRQNGYMEEGNVVDLKPIPNLSSRNYSVMKEVHNPNGKYIENLLKKFQKCDQPYLLAFQGTACHAIVSRTDKAPEQIEEGSDWWKVYIYDPNTPYMNPKWIPEGYNEDNLRSSYYNNILKNKNEKNKDCYIELNPKENKWRYAFSATANTKGNLQGCDENGNVLYSEYKKGDNTYQSQPHLMYMHDLNYAPTSFNGKEVPESEDGITIAINAASSFSIFSQEGDLLAAVENGEAITANNDIQYLADIGGISDQKSSKSGRLIIPQKTFSIETEKPDHLVIIGENNALQLSAEQGRVSYNIDMDANKFSFKAADNGVVKHQISTIYDNETFTSAILEGNAEKDKTTEIKLDASGILNINTDQKDLNLNVTAKSEANTEGVVFENMNTEKLNQQNVKDLSEQKGTAVTGVALDKENISLKSGETSPLTANITPATATNKTIIWSTSNEKVATVKDGTVTAIGEGTATITAKTEDGGFTADCRVMVSALPGPSTEPTTKPSANPTPSTSSNTTVTDQPSAQQNANAGTGLDGGSSGAVGIAAALVILAIAGGTIYLIKRKK